MSVTIQEQSQKMEELCEEIEVLIDMSFNLPTLVTNGVAIDSIMM
jgi:hypothetical protein